MAFSEFVISNFWYILLAVFLAGTFILSRTKTQRSFILFLIKTKHGIKLLEKIGSISPSTWKFLGDLAVIVSFGGLGAVYVTKYRRPYPLIIILGVIALLVTSPILMTMNIIIPAGLFILLLISVFGVNKLSRKNQQIPYFIITAIIIFFIFLGFAGSLKPGIPGIIIAGITSIFGLPGLLIGSLATQASNILLQQSSLPGISPLIPGLSPQGQIGFVFPGFDIFIPLWSGLIALIILLVTHEFSHGILARVQGVKVNNMGLVTCGILPIGAFVEPDEKSLEKKKSEEKMRVYAMGSFANLSVAILSILLLITTSLAVSGMVKTDGVEIVSVMKGFPAEVLEAGSVIKSINGVEITGLEDYLEEASKILPGDEINLVTDKGIFSIKSVENPENSSRAYLGFNLKSSIVLNNSNQDQGFLLGLLLGFMSLLEVVFFLNLNIAIVNLLPIMPFDGSKMFDELLKSFKISSKTRKKIVNWVIILLVGLLFLNALPLAGVLLTAIGI